jgi:molybdate transport system ATP-binding protein
VALARALAAEPEVLLLDEPMAGLDVATATAMRTLLRQVLTTADRCAVLVTHDLLDVTALADRVLIIDDGRIVESGPVAAVLAAPSTAFAARFAGVNLVAGSAEDDTTLRTTTGRQLAGFGAGNAVIMRDQSVIAVFTPAAVRVDRERPPAGAGMSTLEVTVAELDHRGAAIRVRAEPLDAGAAGLAADISGQRAAELRLIPGERVFFTVAADQVAIRPADRA